jgi:hypothetical protein
MQFTYVANSEHILGVRFFIKRDYVRSTILIIKLCCCFLALYCLDQLFMLRYPCILVYWALHHTMNCVLWIIVSTIFLCRHCCIFRTSSVIVLQQVYERSLCFCILRKNAYSRVNALCMPPNIA